VIEDLESKSILILQSNLINNLESKFGQEACNKVVYKTPGNPRFKIVVYRYRRCPLLLVQVNIEHDRIRIFYVFTHLITDSDVVCLTV
jgi:hypothetical protein